MSDAFDFRAKVQGVRPRPVAAPAAAVETADQVAEQHDFVSREPARRVKRVRQSEPIEVLSIKGPLSVMNRFKEYANKNGHTSYWTALDALLKKASSR